MRRISICIIITTVIIIHQDGGLKAKNKLHQRQVAVNVCDADILLGLFCAFYVHGKFLKFDRRIAPTLVDAFIKFAFF